MDQPNIEVALKRDQTDQENTSAEEVFQVCSDDDPPSAGGATTGASAGREESESESVSAGVAEVFAAAAAAAVENESQCQSRSRAEEEMLAAHQTGLQKHAEVYVPSEESVSVVMSTSQNPAQHEHGYQHQDETTRAVPVPVLVHRLQDFEGIVVDGNSQLGVLDESAEHSLQQLQQHIKQQEQSQQEQQRQSSSSATAQSYPVLQTFQPVYVHSLQGEVLQIINPMRMSQNFHYGDPSVQVHQPSISLDQQSGLAMRSPLIQSADVYRLTRMFPDFHPKTLHRILAMCHGDLKRAIDQTLFARQLRVLDLSSPFPQINPHMNPIGTNVHAGHHGSPYRLQRGSLTPQINSSLVLYPESHVDAFANSATTASRRSAGSGPQPPIPSTATGMNGGVPPIEGAAIQMQQMALPPFHSMFLPVYQSARSQQQLQDTSRLVVPDDLMPEDVPTVHIVKLEQLNSTNGVSESEEESVRISPGLGTIPITVPTSCASGEPEQTIQSTTIRRLLDGKYHLEGIDLNNRQLEPLMAQDTLMMTTAKVDIGASGDRDESTHSLLASLADVATENHRSIISH